MGMVDMGMVDMGMVDMGMVDMGMVQRNRLIVKNTLLLYIRMFITMGIGLYTGRVILNALGVENYGIYNVVGGIVALSSLLTSSLSSSISRFITFEIGTGNLERLKAVFSTSIIIQTILSIVIIILLESIGVWFLSHKMVIPSDRLFAARCVFQISIITCVIGLFRVPFTAAIIAHEKMNIFAYLTVVETIAKLTIAYLITISPIDKLIFHALLMFSLSCTVNLLYFIYGKRLFEECRDITFRPNREVFREMFSFAGWNFIGCSSAIIRDSGGNILLNLFGGLEVNAAKAISDRVINSVSQFSSNFMTALTPQITKSYALGESGHMMSLIFRGSRFSFYLLLLLSLPIFFNTEYILTLWLKNVPKHTVLFVQLTLIYCMLESLSTTLINAMCATGNIRDYQIVVGGFMLLNFPISYICLRMGAMPEVVVIVAIFVSLCCLGLRLYMLRGMIGLSVGDFIRKVILNILVVALISIIFSFCINTAVGVGIIAFLVITILSISSTAAIVYFIGCNRFERRFINGFILNIFNLK